MRPLVLSALAVLALSACGGRRERHDAGPGGWEHLGTRMVNFGGDHDTIPCAHQGTFRKIKIEVDGGDLLMHNIVVHFGNGEKFSPDTRFEFNSNTGSRIIDLPGGDRVITKIDFHYRSQRGGRGGRATLKAYGQN